MDKFLIKSKKTKEKIDLLPDVWMESGDLPNELENINFNTLWNLHPESLGKIKIMGREIDTPRYQQSYDNKTWVLLSTIEGWYDASCVAIASGF